MGYPEWGFMQLEVASDRNIQQADTVWNVEEHRYTQNDKDKSTIEKEMMTHELIPEGQTSSPSGRSSGSCRSRC